MVADVVDPRRKAFLGMNAAAFVAVALAALAAWQTERATDPLGLAALLLVLVAIGLAVGSYPFYRASMRDELARRAAERKSKRKT